jgi:hypothetical protein
MVSSRLPRETALEKKRKEFKKANGEEQMPVKKFKDYNFTPLNAEISEVLMEIKRDPVFHQPPKIPGNPPYRKEQVPKSTGLSAPRSVATGLLSLRPSSARREASGE